jgi:hypothetical protein
MTQMSTNENPLMIRKRILYEDLSYKIVGFAMEVHRQLGYGYLEKVYENAMMVLLHRGGIEAKQQHSVFSSL